MARDYLPISISSIQSALKGQHACLYTDSERASHEGVFTVLAVDGWGFAMGAQPEETEQLKKI